LALRDLLHILRCPRCRAELRADAKEETLVCTSCARSYAVERGIPVLIDSLERPS
jgi:uncharacterized protein YbaR (Trm112 family)